MIKKITYMSLVFDIKVKPDNIELKNVEEIDYSIEIDCIESNTILEEQYKKYIEDKYIVDKMRDKINERKVALEREKNVIINITDWEFQVDLENMENISDLDMKSREKLLKEKDIMISITSQEETTIFNSSDVKELIDMRKTLF